MDFSFPMRLLFSLPAAPEQSQPCDPPDNACGEAVAGRLKSNMDFRIGCRSRESKQTIGGCDLATSARAQAHEASEKIEVPDLGYSYLPAHVHNPVGE